MEKEKRVLSEMSEYSLTGDILHFPFSVVYKVAENEKKITALEFLRDNLLESTRDAVLRSWENIPDVCTGAIYSGDKVEIYLAHTQPFKDILAIYPFAN
ncbi:MAG: hypothetical protein WC981_00830 [Candidatus Dojkabacteria bacterium]|jgi:hypothetical protein